MGTTSLAAKSVQEGAKAAGDAVTPDPPKPPEPPEAPEAPSPPPKQAASRTANERQRKKQGAASSGQSSTILTGPGGVTGSSNTASKTLLGS